jgi:1-acyl-sn-glycerol-3-phosphate acyltransferase
MHFYPEGSMWLFYPDIRPFKPAVFKYAVKYDRPIVPLTMSFRPRKGPTKLFTKKPQVDLHV